MSGTFRCMIWLHEIVACIKNVRIDATTRQFRYDETVTRREVYKSNSFT